MIYDEISKYSVTQIDDVLRYARKPNFKLNEVDSAMQRLRETYGEECVNKAFENNAEDDFGNR